MLRWGPRNVEATQRLGSLGGESLYSRGPENNHRVHSQPDFSSRPEIIDFYNFSKELTYFPSNLETNSISYIRILTWSIISYLASWQAQQSSWMMLTSSFSEFSSHSLNLSLPAELQRSPSSITAAWKTTQPEPEGGAVQRTWTSCLSRVVLVSITVLTQWSENLTVRGSNNRQEFTQWDWFSFIFAGHNQLMFFCSIIFSG